MYKFYKVSSCEALPLATFRFRLHFDRVPIRFCGMAVAGAVAIPPGGHLILRIVVRKIGQTESARLLIVRSHESLAISAYSRVCAASRLHAESRLDAGDHVGTGSVVAVATAAKHLVAVGISAREVEQVDTSECGEEPAK